MRERAKTADLSTNRHPRRSKRTDLSTNQDGATPAPVLVREEYRLPDGRYLFTYRRA
jgi:hypothetical protein